jgi:hypothetical protein
MFLFTTTETKGTVLQQHRIPQLLESISLYKVPGNPVFRFKERAANLVGKGGKWKTPLFQHVQSYPYHWQHYN